MDVTSSNGQVAMELAEAGNKVFSCNGGYVIAGDSVMADGKRDEVIDDREDAPVPAVCVDLTRASMQSSRTSLSKTVVENGIEGVAPPLSEGVEDNLGGMVPLEKPDGSPAHAPPETKVEAVAQMVAQGDVQEVEDCGMSTELADLPIASVTDTESVSSVAVEIVPEVAQTAAPEPVTETPVARRKAQLTVFAKDRGILTKRISFQDGKVIKDASECAMSRGRFRRVAVNDVDDLGQLIGALSPVMALAYGIQQAMREGQVVSKKDLHRHPGAVTRTKDNFTYPAGPAVLMVDYDPAPGAPPLSPDELYRVVVEAMPELAGVEMWWTPSASSCIYDQDGNEIAGVTGQRLYFLVEKGTEIPRIGEALFVRLWLAGHGRIDISRAGTLLVRTIVDGCVWSPERLDFAAGAVCGGGLERRPAPHRVFAKGGNRLLSTATVPPLSDEKRRQYQAMVDAAKQATEPARQERRNAYIEERVSEIGGDPQQARATIQQALDTHVLGPDWPLHLDTGEVVTVGQVLADKRKYHGATLADPLEPEYGGGGNKAKLYLSGTRPVINSFAHGGRIFHLVATRTVIEICKGFLADAIAETTRALANEPDLLRIDAGLVLVTESPGGPPKTALINVETLTARATSSCRFLQRNGQGVLVPADPSERLIRTIAGRRDSYEFRPLKAVITAPTLRPDGTLLCIPGYDEQTGLLFLSGGDEIPAIPNEPTAEDTENAIEYLWKPFDGFPFETAIDESVFFALLLTASVRRILPTAPGAIISAHSAGTGKTKLAQCISLLAGGTDGIHAYPKEEEELRKAIMAALLEGRAGIIFDNVTGQLKSDLLCALLTSSTHTDRILGASKSATVSTRTMLLATGNNLEAAGDLSRRVLRINLDAGCERPWTRTFDFDPVEWVRERRLSLVAAALTLLRAYIAAGWPDVVSSHTGSFEAWSRLVRSTVVWLGYEDPEKALHENLESDSETQELRDVMTAWAAAFGVGHVVLTKDLTDRLIQQAFNPDPVRIAFLDVLGGATHLTAKSIGKWLGYRRGRIVDGLRFDKVSNGAARGWRLVLVAGGGSAGATDV